MNQTDTTTEHGGVLIIEDDSSFAETLRMGLKEAGVDQVTVESSFAKGLAVLDQCKPDVLVLDIYSGTPPEGTLEGSRIYDSVWERRFLPIVLTSAFIVPSLQEKTSHPLVKYVYKNDPEINAHQRVIELVRETLPFGREVTHMWESLAKQVAEATQDVLKELVGIVWTDIEHDPCRSERLCNAARRRLRASLEAINIETGLPLQPWEQYIVPPLGAYLRAADLLQQRGADAADATAYRIVLTPTCDMVAGEGRTARVEKVLVAVCVPIGEYQTRAQLPKPVSPSFDEKWRKALSQPHQAGLTPLPALPSFIPHMAASHRKTELIGLADIDVGGRDASDGRLYLRVASLDSPFREQLVWAYLEIAGRPGVPDRDFNKWCASIREALQRDESRPAND